MQAQKASVCLAFTRRTKSAKSGGPERKGRRKAVFERLGLPAVNRSVLKTAGNLRLGAPVAQAENSVRM